MSAAASDLGVRARTGVLIVVTMVGAMAAGPWAFAPLLVLVWLLGSLEAVRLIRVGFPSASIWLSGLMGPMLWAMSVSGLAGLGWGDSGYVPWLPLGWFVLIWLNDTGAYFAGRAWGRHKLAPSISPGKTWEGWAGGLVASLLGSMGLAWGLPVEEPWWVLALVVAVFGPAGDLAESALKRRAGIKDSGRVLPGHGGVLDRFDSHIFAAPLAAILLRLI